MKSYLTQYKELLLSPTSFFQIKKKEYLKHSIIFLLVLMAAYNFTEAVFGALLYASFGGTILDYVGLILGFFFSVLFVLVFSFLVAGLIHIGVLLMKGKKGYKETYKAVAYSNTISLVYAIPLLVIALFISFSEGVFLAEGHLKIMILATLFGVASFIHIVYADIMGLHVLQELTKTRAALAILIGLGVAFVISLIFVVFIGIFALLLVNLGYTL